MANESNWQEKNCQSHWHCR